MNRIESDLIQSAFKIRLHLNLSDFSPGSDVSGSVGIRLYDYLP